MPPNIALAPAPTLSPNQQLRRYGLLFLGLVFLIYVAVWAVQTIMGDQEGSTPRASAVAEVTLLPTEAQRALVPTLPPTETPQPTATVSFVFPTATLPADGGLNLQPTTTATWPPTPVGTFTPIPSATSFPALPTLPTATPVPSATPQIGVTSSGVAQVQIVSPEANIRTGPGPEYPIISALQQGTILQVVSRNSRVTWLYVITPRAQWGWVYVPLVTPLNGLVLADVLVASVIPTPPLPTPAITSSPLPPLPTATTAVESTDVPPPPAPSPTTVPTSTSPPPTLPPVPSPTPVPPPVPTLTPIPPPAPTPTPIPPP